MLNRDGRTASAPPSLEHATLELEPELYDLDLDRAEMAELVLLDM
jgi:hypothetical protein